jgi:hypothetical protein
MGRVPEGGWGVKPLAWCVKPPSRRLTSFGVTFYTIPEKRLPQIALIFAEINNSAFFCELCGKQSVVLEHKSKMFLACSDTFIKS